MATAQPTRRLGNCSRRKLWPACGWTSTGRLATAKTTTATASACDDPLEAGEPFLDQRQRQVGRYASSSEPFIDLGWQQRRTRCQPTACGRNFGRRRSGMARWREPIAFDYTNGQAGFIHKAVVSRR